MIGYLSGTIKFLFEDSCILNVQGVGYKVFVDAQTRQSLKLDAEAEFFIHTAVREDAITLYGMTERETFELFELLITVSGIGAKGALSIVSKISPDDFSRAVLAQDIKTLTRLPGVGKKSAERILLELREKVKPPEQRELVEKDEAEAALEALGYTAAEIATAFKSASPHSSTEQLIRSALQHLSKAGVYQKMAKRLPPLT